MDNRQDTTVEALLEHLIEHGPDDIGTVFARAFELAMRIERERFLRAGPYERTAERQGYANGYKPKRIDTPAGTVTVDVPKTAGHEGAPFYPQSLERGRRSVRAVMLAVAEMYVKGVSTREVEAVMREFGIESLSSSQVSRAAKLLDDELEAWRTRPLGEIRYLMLDARYEKMRFGGVVREAAVLSAIGIGPDERRRVLGVSIALSEAEVHWRAFLESLQARGMRGVEYVVSDDHAGLRAARRAVLGGATWQRCQFHLARNAIHHAPSLAIRKRIGSELREVWNAGSLAKAETALAELVAGYRDAARLAAWLETNVPEGLAVFSLPEHHRRRLRPQPHGARGSAGDQRRTVKVRVFPTTPRSTPRQRRTRRDRRQVGHRHEGLHQVGMPGCVITPAENFQTTGCSIRTSERHSSSWLSRRARATQIFPMDPDHLTTNRADGFTGVVTRVVDGDTFWLNSQDLRIRVWGLDAPRVDMPGGSSATAALSNMIGGQQLSCRQRDIDRYGRIVGQCFLADGRDITAAMIASGTAQEYCRYSRNHYRTC